MNARALRSEALVLCCSVAWIPLRARPSSERDPAPAAPPRAAVTNAAVPNAEGPNAEGPNAEGPDAEGPRPRLNAAGEERPAFLLRFPRDPELDALIAAFERGDFAQIRRDAEQLARSTPDNAVRDAARELRRRIDPDPLLVLLLMLALSVFVFVVAWVYAQ
jgi:hypothetical protein